MTRVPPKLARGALLALLPAAACSDEPGLGAAPEPRGPAPSLDALEAVGYAGWSARDPGADGVTVFDRARAGSGFNLTTDEVDRVLLLDMEGRRVHTWRVEGFERCEFAALLDGGRVAALGVDEGLALVERDSRTLWRVALNAHHEVVPLEGGAAGFLVPAWEERDYLGRRVRFDRIVHVSADGVPADWWSAWEHRAELRALHPPLALDTPPEPGGADGGKVYDYYHVNSIAVLPDTPAGRADPRLRAGNLLVCARNASLVFVLDRETRGVAWHWGPGELDFPHMPRMTPAGTILVFDNGWHRGWSRVLELDPRTLEQVWEYRAEPSAAFFTQRRGSCQRLLNGNTLICESERGRAFEVTPEGELVWEFLNPERRGARRKRIYRLLRVGAGQADFLGR